MCMIVAGLVRKLRRDSALIHGSFAIEQEECRRAAFFLSFIRIARYINAFLVNIIGNATKKNENSPWLGGHDLNRNR
ncbi:hypothetical protein Pint_15287 [Pistacia integerrima]|uniref:Uncharacterized protein n=1 Tax=Pistacia integerrima TaxID=434235 RepID=A0ACC0ZCC5_9ROSI|nr:hypothetical protein Pint_15287 [Pistacia integerrima]